jgi:hypothetical protein
MAETTATSNLGVQGSNPAASEKAPATVVKKNTKATRHSLNKKPMTEKQIETREKVMASQTVTIQLAPGGEARLVKIKSGEEVKEYMSEGDPEQVTINGYVYHIPRGVMVDVPKGVAEIIRNQKVTMQYFNEELKRNFKYGGKSAAATYEN